MTTKEQEIKALEQIRKIVNSLGEDSYIATAFEGCFEIAAENIDNDFACSMKQRAELAEYKVKDLQQIRDILAEENDQLRKELEETKAKAAKAALRQEDLEEFQRLANEKAIEAMKTAEEKAQIIVDTADSPGSAVFMDSVKKHREAKGNQAYYEAIIWRIGRMLQG